MEKLLLSPHQQMGKQKAMAIANRCWKKNLFFLSVLLHFSIGYSIAERLASEGAKVVISSRKENNVNKAIAQLKDKGLTDVRGVKCHVAVAEDRRNLLKTAVDNFGGVDILVSNAAVNPTVGSVLDCPEEAWDKIFEVNVKAAYLLAKEFAPVISDRSCGSIVFVSSYAGMSPFPVRAFVVAQWRLQEITEFSLSIWSYWAPIQWVKRLCSGWRKPWLLIWLRRIFEWIVWRPEWFEPNSPRLCMNPKRHMIYWWPKCHWEDWANLKKLLVWSRSSLRTMPAMWQEKLSLLLVEWRPGFEAATRRKRHYWALNSYYIFLKSVVWVIVWECSQRIYYWFQWIKKKVYFYADKTMKYLS